MGNSASSSDSEDEGRVEYKEVRVSNSRNLLNYLPNATIISVHSWQKDREEQHDNETTTWYWRNLI